MSTDAPAPSAPSPRRRTPLWVAIPTAIALAWVLGGLWFHWDADPAAIGNAEMLLGWALLATVFVAVVGVPLRRPALAVIGGVALLLTGIFTSEPQGDLLTGSVAVAGAPELQAAAREGTPRGLATAIRTPGVPVAPAPTRAGMQCQRVIVRDHRRSLLGVQTRRFSATVLGCWSRDGAPALVQLLADVRPGGVPASTRLVRLQEWAPLTSGALLPREPTRPQDRADVGSLMQQQKLVRPFRPGQRPLSGAKIGPVQMTSSGDGARLRLVAAWLTSGAGTPDREVSQTVAFDRDVMLGLSPRRREALDVLVVQFSRGGEPEAELVRLRRGRPAAALARRATSARVQLPGGVPVEQLTLSGGK